MTPDEKKETSADDLPKVNLDTILVEELGQFGRFQLRTMLLILVVVVFGSWGGNEYLFSTARIDTRCYIRECDGVEPEFAPPWILNAVPGTSQTSFEGCQRFPANTTSVNSTSTTDVCPPNWFNRNDLVSCEKRIYENTLTVTYDFDLGCDEWRRTLIGSIRTMGTLLALPLTGFVSDRWGRRTALVICAINTGWIALARYFTTTYALFVVCLFFEQAFGSGSFSSAFILLTEMVGPKYRVASGATAHTFFSFGQIILGFIAWGIPYWRHLILALYIPQLLVISYFWLLTESVRWHISKRQYDESERILKHIAKVNNRQLSDKSLEALKASAEEEKKEQVKLKAEKQNEPWLILLVFREKAILIRCIVSPIWWITMTVIFYGMSINAVNMTGNKYINFAAVSVAQIPGYWVGVLLMNKIGRKPVLISAYWICGACQLGYAFMPDDMYALSLAIYLLGTLCSAVIAFAIYVYTSELFPTRYRHRLFAFSSMCGRVGSILAPLTPALGAAVWEKLPFLIFAGLALLSGILLLLTPETLGAKLPDTMEEAAQLGHTKKP